MFPFALTFIFLINISWIQRFECGIKIARCFQGTPGPNSAILILWKSENVGSKS